MCKPLLYQWVTSIQIYFLKWGSRIFLLHLQDCLPLVDRVEVEMCDRCCSLTVLMWTDSCGCRWMRSTSQYSNTVRLLICWKCNIQESTSWLCDRPRTVAMLFQHRAASTVETIAVQRRQPTANLVRPASVLAVAPSYQSTVKPVHLIPVLVQLTVKPLMVRLELKSAERAPAMKGPINLLRCCLWFSGCHTSGTVPSSKARLVIACHRQSLRHRRCLRCRPYMRRETATSPGRPRVPSTAWLRSRRLRKWLANICWKLCAVSVKWKRQWNLIRLRLVTD